MRLAMALVSYRARRMMLGTSMELALIMVALLNALVSVAIAISAGYGVRQKVLQILIIWLVPVLGAAMLGLFLLSQRGNGRAVGYPAERDDDIGQVWSSLHPPDQDT